MDRGLLRAALGLACGFCLVAGTTLAQTDYFNGLDEQSPMKIDAAKGEILVLADLQPSAFSPGWFKRMPGYHALVWKGGSAAGDALFAAYLNDATFHDAMISIGAKPGNNLTMAAWNERSDESSKAPETRVQGSPVDVFAWWEGLKEALPLKALLKDPGGKGLDLRFGGNKALIPAWKSGCILCLQSCPGGKVSNRAYTVRDYVKGRSVFAVNEEVVPEGKRKAVVIFRLRQE